MEQLKSLITNNNFIIRGLSTLVLMPVVLFIVNTGGIVYQAFIFIVAILMAFEWSKLILARESKFILIWQVIGVFYILLPSLSMVWLRDQQKGLGIVYWLLSVVWSTDIFAYIFGSLIGGWKICPKISPNKTWSGLIGGTIAASIVGYVAANLIGSPNPRFLISLSVVLAIYGQCGDMFESWIKRKFGAKDSGHIIPGHGGILDRVDSLVPVAPKVAMVVLFDKWGIF